jgi:hypothetical protein
VILRVLDHKEGGDDGFGRGSAAVIEAARDVFEADGAIGSKVLRFMGGD